MFQSAFFTGFAMSGTLIVAIGAQNAFVLRQGLRREHVAAIVLFCGVADLLLIGAGVAGLAGVLGKSAAVSVLLTLSGAAFLLCYGVLALRRASCPRALVAAPGSAKVSLRSAMLQVAGFTLLNPHVYLDTLLLMGSMGARQPAGLRVWFVGGAAIASGLWFTTLGFGARWLSPLFSRQRAWQILDTLVALVMFALSAQLTRQSLLSLAG
jgi:L-lysine exporter family protein LysE/ArgO